MNNTSIESDLSSVSRAPEGVSTNRTPMESDPSLVGRAQDVAFKDDGPKAKSISDPFPTVRLPELRQKLPLAISTFITVRRMRSKTSVSSSKRSE